MLLDNRGLLVSLSPQDHNFVLRLEEVERPTPKEDEVLVRVHATTVNPVIDRCYPLEDVIEATRYVETEQKTGNVVLTL